MLLFWPSFSGADANRPSVRVAYDAPVTADAPVHKTNAQEMERRSNEVRAASQESAHPDSDLRARAESLFDSVNSGAGSDVVTPALEGWAKPDRSTEGTVDGMMNAMRSELNRTRSLAEAPPPPMLGEAYSHGKHIRDSGLMSYTDSLNESQLGVYVYTKSAPVGIYFNKVFYKLQAALGDAFAAATAIHESAHSRDHDQGKLNPKEVIKGEKLAYETEYWWMKTIDPKGQKLAWARVTFCTPQGGLGNSDKDTCQFLEHLAKIMHYGSNGDFDGLVASLGYKDRGTDPFGNAEMMGYCPFHGRVESPGDDR